MKATSDVSGPGPDATAEYALQIAVYVAWRFKYQAYVG